MIVADNGEKMFYGKKSTNSGLSASFVGVGASTTRNKCTYFYAETGRPGAVPYNPLF